MLFYLIWPAVTFALACSETTGIWTVHTGDTVYEAASALGIGIIDIQRLNNNTMTDVDCVYPMDIFTVPYMKPTLPASWDWDQYCSAALVLGHQNISYLSEGCRVKDIKSVTRSNYIMTEHTQTASTRSNTSSVLTASNQVAVSATTEAYTPITTEVTSHSSIATNLASAASCYMGGDRILYTDGRLDHVDVTDATEHILAVVFQAAELKFRRDFQNTIEDKGFSFLINTNESVGSFILLAVRKSKTCSSKEHSVRLQDNMKLIWQECDHYGGIVVSDCLEYELQLSNNKYWWNILQQHHGILASVVDAAKVTG